MKPYMPPTPENYEQVLRDIHARAIQMWAGCIWVPIYEVMTRKHLKLVTLEENLEMAADIGMDATTSLDEAFAEAMERHGPGREGDRAPVRALPAAAEHGADGRRAAALPAAGARPLVLAPTSPVPGSGSLVNLHWGHAAARDRAGREGHRAGAPRRRAR